MVLCRVLLHHHEPCRREASCKFIGTIMNDTRQKQANMNTAILQQAVAIRLWCRGGEERRCLWPESEF